MKHWGCTCMGMLNLWTIAYTPNGTPPGHRYVSGRILGLMLGLRGILTQRPDVHHDRRQAIGLLGSPVGPYLRDELEQSSVLTSCVYLIDEKGLLTCTHHRLDQVRQVSERGDITATDGQEYCAYTAGS
jgi:hypothetical protein